MSGVSIEYDGQCRSRNEQHPDYGPLRTINVIRPVCRISNLPLGSKDQRLRYFRVYGKKVPVNALEFIDFCDKADWPKPVWEKNNFQIEPWLIDRAKNLVGMPAEWATRKLAVIASFAGRLGLKKKFLEKIRSAAEI
jgi:hypothetical protein